RIGVEGGDDGRLVAVEQRARGERRRPTRVDPAVQGEDQHRRLQARVLVELVEVAHGPRRIRRCGSTPVSWTDRDQEERMSIDVTDATFEAEVIERSTTVPVVVDLWAEWCGPCRTLGPIIEKVVDETQGKVVLAKVDVDANPMVSQAFRVQGIPAVHAVVDRRPVDSFVGAQPENVVRAFV